MPYFKQDINIRLEVDDTLMERKQIHTHQDNPSLSTQRSWIIPLPILPHTRPVAPVKNLVSTLVITTLTQRAVMDVAQLRSGITQHTPPLLSLGFLVFASVRFVTSGKEYLAFIFAARSWSYASVGKADTSSVVDRVCGWLCKNGFCELD